MKDEKALTDFMQTEVNLNRTRYDNARERLNTLRDYLKENLAGFVGTEIQGSYATKTIIKPVEHNDAYDIDLMVYVKNDGTSPKGLIDRVADCLSQRIFYAENSAKKSRCVTVEYANQFNIDVVPCIVGSDGRKWICNRKSNTWEITDGTNYRDWFNEQNRKSNGNLKRAVRLLKHLRDRKNRFTVASVAITTLAGMAVESFDVTKLNTLPNSLEAITEWIDRYLQKNPKANLCNPTLPKEKFDRHWTQKQYQTFRERFHGYTDQIHEAIDAKDPDKSEELWQRIFGPKYRRSNRDSDGGEKPTRPKPGPTSPSYSNARSPALAAAPFSTPRVVTPPRPYATPTNATTRERLKLTPLSAQNLRWLTENQPQLYYNEAGSTISGTIKFSALWDEETKNITVNPWYSKSQGTTLITDEYQATIKLKYKARWLGPKGEIPHRFPPIYIDEMRIAKLALRLKVTLADLHILPDGECCLGFRPVAPDRKNFDLPLFIEGELIPWLYRLSYVEQHGLEQAKQKLWPEYDHRNGPQQYLQTMKQISASSDPDNGPCSCASGKAYRECHKKEIEQLTRDGLLRSINR